MFLGEVATTVKSGIHSTFGVWAFSASDSIGGCGFLSNNSPQEVGMFASKPAVAVPGPVLARAH